MDKSCANPEKLCVRSRTNNTEVHHVGEISDAPIVKVEESKIHLPIPLKADEVEVGKRVDKDVVIIRPADGNMSSADPGME